MGQITDCLSMFRENQNANEEELYALTYDALRKIAARRARSVANVSPTELVHEAWLRLCRADPANWHDSRHFFNAAASAMRFALVDAVRHQNRLKRGSAFSQSDWSESLMCVDPLATEVESLHEALNELEEEHPVKAEIVQMKFFGGMTIKEISMVTELSAATVERYWAYSKAWLYRRMAK